MRAVAALRAPDRDDPLAPALEAVAARADERDRAEPAFPEDALRLLEDAGLLAATLPSAGGARIAVGEEWRLLRRLAAADASVARIVDGHLNGVDRLAALAPEPLRTRELARVAARSRRIGLWGADPAPGEGTPARLAGDRVEGEKVFCSGAGGVDRALVTVAAASGPPLLAYVDVTAATEIDRAWFRGSGLRASESHRVVFHGAPVVAILGGPGELGRDPAFSLDAMRTTACWAGMAEGAAQAGIDALAARGADPLAALAAGRLLGAVATIDAWTEAESRRIAEGRRDGLRARSIHMRAAIAAACRTIVDEATRAAGSRALAAGSGLDRRRRDLELFLLQHRLDPMVARVGADALGAGS